ncbi:MAG: peptidase M14 [Chloroflexi bacterium]|nr:MAG: peptidase M14 [Chloroflexota bacterium]
MDNNLICPGLRRVPRRLLAFFLVVSFITLGRQPVLAAEPLAEFPPFRATNVAQTPFVVVAHVYFADEALLNELVGALDVWEVRYGATPADHYVVAMLSLAQVEAFRTVGLRTEIDDERTASLYQQPVFAAGQTGGIAGYPCYRTVEETYTALAALATAQPDLAQWITIGGSWNQLNPGNGDGHDLRVLVLTNRTIPGPKPRFFLMGAIHAREMTTAELAARFAEALVNGYGHHPDATWLLDYTEVHILPITNPDGRKWAEQLLYWRKNTNRNDGCSNASPFISYYGVDLNRNSGFKWGQCEGQNCSSTAACRDTFRGSGPASEPETQAVESYIRSLFPDQRGPDDDDPAPDDASGLLISLHSYSELVLFPWGWRATPSPNHDQLQTLGNKFGYFNGYRVCQSGAPGCIYMTDGTTDDWAYGELGVAAYTFELGQAFFESCSVFEETIAPSNLPALWYAAKNSRRPYQTPAGPDSVEVAVAPARILSGTAITLTALADDTRHTSNSGIVEPSQPISAARYTIAAPSWITGVESYGMAAADGSFDGQVERVQTTVDTTGWPVGRHLLLVESQDQAGNWGAPTGVFVDVVASPYGAHLEPATVDYQVAADTVFTTTLTLTNTGIASDSFVINVSPPAWEAGEMAPVGPLAPMGATVVAVPIHVPSATPVGATESVTITAASLSSSTALATATIRVQVLAPTNGDGTDEPALTRLLLPLINR